MITYIVFLPLIAALLVGLTVRRIPDAWAQALTCGAMVASAILSGCEFYNVVFGDGPYTRQLFTWVESGDFKAQWALKVDQLTAVMLVVVTWVSSVVHVYSVGYMSHDHSKPRFMCYLSLFTFFMLMLVTSDNFLQLFLGWEGVGLCSYLLIGFWFHKPSACAASIKAFLVNRVGDFGFALGIFAVFALFGSISFEEVFAQAESKKDAMFHFLEWDFHALTLVCILLFIGAMGKSAQLGLHTWLPDAMEGPTPVSALIHAATMVTAGVFMVARCSPLFELSPTALGVVAVVGALTAFFAATVGMVQNDIKRVIAYSTCSQLGYMFFACGVGAYSAGIFHLMTHAFFKALLFLGAGSVIHAMSDEQDIRNMGGIWRKIPVTYAFMWIGSLALAGVPWFAGFYSKDAILEAAFAAGNGTGRFAFWLGIAAAFMTAFYSWRLLILTFHGAPRASKEVMDHIHESPKIMLLPLVLLAAGSLFAGALGYYWLGMVTHEGPFWGGAIFTAASNTVLEEMHHVPAWVKWLPIGAGFGGIGMAYLCYLACPGIPGRVRGMFRPIYEFLLNKWYFDEAYDALFTQPAKALGKHLWKLWDTVVIDGFGPNGLAAASQRLGARVSALQTGYIYHYAFVMLLGLAGLLGWFALRNESWLLVFGY